MYKKGLVSIIIPVYNIEKYVKECLISVLNQTYKNIEIIIVDDRGNDKSMDIVKEVMNSSPFKFRIITQDRNRGVSEARNMGIRSSSGEYIFFLDGDDLITSDCIEVLYNAAIDSNAELVMSDYKRIYSKDFHNALSYAINHKNSEDMIYKNICYDEQNNYIWNTLYKKEFILENNIYFDKDLKFAEDALWITLVQFKANKMIRISTQTYLYRITCESSCIILCSRDSYLNNLILIIEKLFNHIKSGEFSQKENGVLLSRIRTYKNGLYSSAILYNKTKKDINYKRLKKMKLKANEIKNFIMPRKRKLVELVFALFPMLDSYYFYKFIFKIEKLIRT